MTKIRTKKSPSYQLFKEIISEYINSDREKRISPVTQEAMIKIAYDLFLFLINFFSPPSQISTSSSKEMITKYENILSSIFVLDYKATSHAYQTSNHPTQLFEFLKLFPTIDASLLELLLIRITQFLDSVLINVHKMMETPEREKIDIWDLVETIKGLLKHDSPNVTFLVPLETVVSLSALVSLGVLQDSESAITSAVTLIRNANFLQTCHICGIRCSAIFCSICGSIACQTHIEIYNNPSVTSSKVICVKCTQDCSFCGKPLVDEKTLEINDKMVCVSCGRKACSSCSSMSPECEKCGNFICSDCQHVCFQCDGVFCPSCAQKFLLKCDICEKLSCNECQPNMAQDEWCKRLFCSFCDSQGEYCKICGSYLCLVCSQENKGFCSFCVEEVTRDIERFKADIKQNPNCIEKRIAFAALLAKLGEFQKAIEQLQKASQLDPSSISVWLELGDYYTKQPNIEEALICYKKARELAPFSPSVLKRIAKIYLEEGKIEKAKNLLEIAKKAAPKNITVIQSLATLWEALNNSDKAIELLNEAVKIKSNDETVWYDLGILYQRHGFFKEASKAYKNALEINPTDTASWNNLGIVQGILHNKQAAIRCFRLAVALDENDILLWNNLGSSYADTGQHSQALDCFFRALELDNSHVPTLHNLALSWMDLGNHDEAIDILNNALMIESNSSVLLKTLARAHREIGEIEQAAKYENLSSEKKANLTN